MVFVKVENKFLLCRCFFKFLFSYKPFASDVIPIVLLLFMRKVLILHSGHEDSTTLPQP